MFEFLKTAFYGDPKQQLIVLRALATCVNAVRSVRVAQVERGLDVSDSDAQLAKVRGGYNRQLIRTIECYTAHGLTLEGYKLEL